MHVVYSIVDTKKTYMLADFQCIYLDQAELGTK